MKKSRALVCGLLALSLGCISASGQFTTTSPTSKGALPGAVSVIGGLVFDIVGTNG